MRLFARKNVYAQLMSKAMGTANDHFREEIYNAKGSYRVYLLLFSKPGEPDTAEAQQRVMKGAAAECTPALQ